MDQSAHLLALCMCCRPTSAEWLCCSLATCSWAATLPDQLHSLCPGMAPAWQQQFDR